MELNEQTQNDIIKAWKEVFPNSYMSSSKLCLGEGFAFKGYLAKDKSEVANGYFDNDNLSYFFMLDNEGYNNESVCLSVKPKNQYMYCSMEKMRKKTIKEPTLKAIKARFKQIKEFILLHKDNIIEKGFYNIDYKFNQLV